MEDEDEAEDEDEDEDEDDTSLDFLDELDEIMSNEEIEDPMSDEEVEEMEGLPEGWFSAVDPASGEPYYYNESTNETTWDRPEATPEPLGSDGDFGFRPRPDDMNVSEARQIIKEEKLVDSIKDILNETDSDDLDDLDDLDNLDDEDENISDAAGDASGATGGPAGSASSKQTFTVMERMWRNLGDQLLQTMPFVLNSEDPSKQMIFEMNDSLFDNAAVLSIRDFLFTLNEFGINEESLEEDYETLVTYLRSGESSSVDVASFCYDFQQEYAVQSQ